MNIGILGSGIVGKTLSAGFIKHGYTVMAGSRSPEKISGWKKEISEKLKTGDFSETAAFGEIIILATKGTMAVNALNLAGASNLSGKIIIDATNPIADIPPINGIVQFFTSSNQSLVEILQEKFNDAHFVKAFNSVGAAVMVNPKFEVKPTMFICGNNEKAKQAVTEILDKFGWETEDMGMADAARSIEQLCVLWCIRGFRKNSWTHAFKLLKQ